MKDYRALDGPGKLAAVGCKILGKGGGLWGQCVASAHVFGAGLAGCGIALLAQLFFNYGGYLAFELGKFLALFANAAGNLALLLLECAQGLGLLGTLLSEQLLLAQLLAQQFFLEVPLHFD